MKGFKEDEKKEKGGDERPSQKDRKMLHSPEHVLGSFIKASLEAGSQRAVSMIRIAFMVGMLLILSSCTHTYQFTYTKKSGIEQLLITKAVDEAVQKMTLDIKGSRVFVDVACLMRDERSYIKKAFNHWFLGAGVLIADYPWDADYIASVLVKVAGTDGDQYLLGVPAIPIPLTVSITTPTLTVFSAIIQKGRVEMEVMVYSAKAGMKEKIPSLQGDSYFKKYVILFVPFTKKDIP